MWQKRPTLDFSHTHIRTYTKSIHLCFSYHSEIAPCSPLMREVGEVAWNGKKRQRNARKGESWPLGLAEASSVSEGAGCWTKWLIHFPRDPLPPSLCTQTHTHTPFPLWMSPVIQVLASAEIATWPLVTRREPSWGVRSWQNPPTVCPCVFLAVKTTGGASRNMAATGPCLTPWHFFIFWQQRSPGERRNWSLQRSVEFRS